MSHKKTKNRKPAASSPASLSRASEPSESRAAEVSTIVWMLAFMATSLAVGGMLVLWFLLGGDERWTGLRRGLIPLLHFVGLITGALGLGLTPVVYRLRVVLPPLTITVLSVVVSLAPWAMLVFRWPRYGE